MTDRALAHVQEALLAAEARFRAAMDAGFDAFVIVRAVRDADGTITDFVIVDANARAAALVDLAVADLLGRPLLDVFVHSRGTGLFEQCCTVVETRQPLEATQHAPLPGQTGRWVDRQLVPVDDGVAISSRDVTARHLERMALEASERRHRELFEANDAIQLLIDLETGALLDVNPAAARFYGWPRETMRSMLIADIDTGPAEAWQFTPADHTDAVTAQARHVHRVASGERRQIEAYRGRVSVGERAAYHVIVQDISERLRAEEQLRESEARFRAVITGMRDGVVLHDRSGAIRVHNPSAARILGLSGAQLLGLQPPDRDWEAIREDGTAWPPETHPAMRALQTGESQPLALMGIRRGDGEYAWLQVCADPLLRDGDREPYAAVALFSDITELRSAEERLRQAQKLEAVGQLAGGIAHDFNNALTVIRGATGFVRDAIGSLAPAGETTVGALDDLGAIERATDRAEGLTRQLLAFGRRQTLRAEFIDLNGLVREYAITLRETLPVGIRLQVTPSDAPATAMIDRRRMIDALRIVTDNAREAMPEGGVVTIGVADVMRTTPMRSGATSPVRRFVQLSVQDTGVGMSEAVQAHLFEPFFSTQPFGASRGMGLASVHGMLAQSNGFVECESAPDAGTTFRLFVPFVEAAPPPRGSAARPPERLRVGAPLGALLVEDDPMMRELGRRMLESLGYAVVVAESGSDALGVLASSAASIPLVVTDLVMPAMSGLELVTNAVSLHPTLAFVAMSGHPVPVETREALSRHRVPLLAKPFTRDALAQAIAQALPSAAVSTP